MKYLYAYRNIAVPANLVTLVGAYTLLANPTLAVLSYLIWWKLFVSAILIAFIHFFQSDVVIFFMNLGLGRIQFYTTIVVIDMLFFIPLMVLVLWVR